MGRYVCGPRCKKFIDPYWFFLELIYIQSRFFGASFKIFKFGQQQNGRNEEQRKKKPCLISTNVKLQDRIEEG